MSTPTPNHGVPSSADLRETARRLAMLEADGIHNEDDARAVATVATWLHAVADAQDAAAARAIVDRMLGRAA